MQQSLAATMIATRDLGNADHASRQARKALIRADKALRAADRSVRIKARDARPGSVTEMRLLGITPAYVASIRAVGPRYRTLSDEQMVGLRVKGVTAQYLRALGAAGHGAESIDAIGDAAILGLSAETVRGYSQIGPRRSLEELAELKMMGVTPEFIAAARRAGHPSLSADQLIKMRLTGRPPAGNQSTG